MLYSELTNIKIAISPRNGFNNRDTKPACLGRGIAKSLAVIVPHSEEFKFNLRGIRVDIPHQTLINTALAESIWQK